MSAGNVNTKGAKKNNHPFQFKVLRLLGNILETSDNILETSDQNLSNLTPVLTADAGNVALATTNAAKQLTTDTPAGSVGVRLMVEAPVGSTDATKCVRYETNNADPSTAPSGMFLGDGDVLDLSLKEMLNFSYCSGFAGEAATIWAQFYE